MILESAPEEGRGTVLTMSALSRRAGSTEDPMLDVQRMKTFERLQGIRVRERERMIIRLDLIELGEECIDSTNSVSRLTSRG